jgi:hypothetical protein
MENYMKNYYDPGFYGTENYTKHYSILLCDSVVHFAKEKEAFWLLDMIWSYAGKLRKYPIVFITVDVDTENGTAVFYAKEDSGKPDIVRQEIEFTSLDVSVKLYYQNNVVMFPSDY